MKSLWKNSLFLACVVILFSACLKEEVAEQAASQNATIAGFTSFSLLENSKTVLNQPFLTHHLHKAGDTTNFANCEIPIDELDIDNPAQITCWLDVEEFDLYFHGINLEVNVPAGVCDYLVYKPFWFYQYAAGFTSGILDIYELPDSDEGSCTGTCSFKNSAGVTVDAVNCTSLIGSQPNNDQPFFFDHSADSSFDEPNCDQGEIIERTFSFDFEAGSQSDCFTFVNPNVNRKNGEGQLAACAQGPVLVADGWGEESEADFTDRLGFPVSLITEAENGHIGVYNYPGPIEEGFASNMLLANYTWRAGGGGLTPIPGIPEPSSFGWPDAERYYVPQRLFDYTAKGLDPSNFNSSPGLANPSQIIRNHDPFWKTSGGNSEPNAFYEYLCTNRAYEIKGRILLQVRDINERFNASDIGNFPLYKANISNPSLDFMDSVGFQPEPIPHPLNDYNDWDDFVSPFVPASADLGVGSLNGGLFNPPIFTHPRNNL